MATGNEVNAYIQHASHIMAQVYHAANRDGSLAALGRDAIKDVRSEIHQVFFGRGERGGEPGAPLNPLFHDIVQDRKEHAAALAGGRPEEPLPSPGQILAAEHRGNVHGPQPARGTVQGDIYGYARPGEATRGEPGPAVGPPQEPARGQAAPGGAAGPEKGVYGPEQGVYGPEHGVYGRGGQADAAATPGQILRDDERAAEGQPHLGRGVEVAQAGPSPAPIPGGLAERILNERKDGYQLPRGKVLPDDQMETNQGTNKGRDR
jgi:hypothetical protein